MEMQDKLTDVNTTIQENTESYYTDVYNPGQIKEQLAIGQEVADKNIRSGTIDTSDTTLTKVNNIYRLSVADPTGKIFSMTIDGLSKTFQNTSGYTELETALQTWLGVAYIVEYDTGTFFNLSRVDGQAITYSNPDLVRNIALSNTPDDWNVHSKIDIIIDGTTYTLDGTVYSDSTSVLNALVTTLTGSTYFVKRETANLVIARQDGAIPTITKTQYNRYTYNLLGRDSTIGPTSADLGGIDGATRAKAYIARVTMAGVNYSYTLATGITWTSSNYSYDASAFAGSPNWTIENTEHRASALADVIWAGLTTGYTKSGETYTGTSGSDRNVWDFDFYKSDRSQHTLSAFSTDYVKDSTLAIATSSGYAGLTLTETNQLADITVTTYTEISKTFTLLSNNFYIPTYNLPNKIKITAISSGGTSEGEYKLRNQSTTARYGTTVETIQDLIFKTDASNYGNIVLIKRGGFIITWTTNTSNILNWTCE